MHWIAALLLLLLLPLFTYCLFAASWMLNSFISLFLICKSPSPLLLAGTLPWPLTDFNIFVLAVMVVVMLTVLLPCCLLLASFLYFLLLPHWFLPCYWAKLEAQTDSALTAVCCYIAALTTKWLLLTTFIEVWVPGLILQWLDLWPDSC